MDTKGHLDKAYCSACHKPGLICAGTPMWKRDCFHDKTGYYWCEKHANRGRLLNWAKAHDYNAISFVDASGRRYAIGCVGEKPRVLEEMWKLAVLCGQDDAIDVAGIYIQNAQFMEEDA